MRHPFADVAAGDLFRQRQVVLIMARFGSQQRDVKAVQLVVQVRRQLGEAFAGSRFDVSAADQFVDQRCRIVGADPRIMPLA